ncbi:MAG TPA: hypothetical protein EYH09_00995 [Candidatus Nanopusillus sp.]|nr:hypothetical protein [Candidatus Nanopusillus sp.]
MSTRIYIILEERINTVVESIDISIINKFKEIEEKLGRSEISIVEALKQMKELKGEYAKKIKIDEQHI